jgi:hypothetical protein
VEEALGLSKTTIERVDAGKPAPPAGDSDARLVIHVRLNPQRPIEALRWWISRPDAAGSLGRMAYGFADPQHLIALATLTLSGRRRPPARSKLTHRSVTSRI